MKIAEYKHQTEMSAREQARQDFLNQRKAYRLNESSQYVVDDLPKGVESKVEHMIDKITEDKVYENMSEYYHLIMADLKKFRVDTNAKIDKHYVD